VCDPGISVSSASPIATGERESTSPKVLFDSHVL